MTLPILATKLYRPPPRPRTVLRPQLVERLNASLHGKLTLVSAPAGFGKTTLVSQWAAGLRCPVAWLSLDEADNDLGRFLVYLVAALRTALPGVGEQLLVALQSPQPPAGEAALTGLLNEMAAAPGDMVLVLDDYHVIDSGPIEKALFFLLEHLPANAHVVLATREDPRLPLARYRARGLLTELRAGDLRFSPPEANGFFNQVMGLSLSDREIQALETRTEGWIAGLQLAAVSLQGQADVDGFIRSFTGSHRFVMDYLVEEVLQQQPEAIQNFLLCTSVLERMCAALCDAVLCSPAISGQAALQYLEQANLFIMPLDDTRQWYRYHRLFADLLRQRLGQQQPDGAAEIHRRASLWYAAHDLDQEAFHHAVAAGDMDLAARLVQGKGMPLHFRGAVNPVLSWLQSLPAADLDARPGLWVMYASALSMTGQLDGVEPRLQAAEAALSNADHDEESKNLTGHIAAIRALIAATQNRVEDIITQSQRALEYLHPENLSVRTATVWKLGIAYQIQGDRDAAGRAYREAVDAGQASGNFIIALSAGIGLGSVQETDTQLHQAAQTYQNALDQAGEQPLPVAGQAQLGLARIYYQWNDLERAQNHAQVCLDLTRQAMGMDSYAAGQVFMAHLDLARGDVTGALAHATEAEQFARRYDFPRRLPAVAGVRGLALLRHGDVDGAARLAGQYELPILQARVYLAAGEAARALEVLETLCQQAQARAWADERLAAGLLRALACQAVGQVEQAVSGLGVALSLARPGGFVRIFIDEGAPMAQLLSQAAAAGIEPAYVAGLLAAWRAEQPGEADQQAGLHAGQALLEPLS
ncbi:MAG: LuxR family transcriptional regulator, partial [Chloroflexi bacterium]|nr:LuxR family transcriptional regulator [Chloroflexota bacterium]